jgi:hypothetical protein
MNAPGSDAAFFARLEAELDLGAARGEAAKGGGDAGTGPGDGVRIVAFGEISAILSSPERPGMVYKRLPLFADAEAARAYADRFAEYSGALREAGLTLPRQETAIVERPGRNAVLYIGQEALPAEAFCHARARRASVGEALTLVERIVAEIGKLRAWNEAHRPRVELALDGQLSNWAIAGSPGAESLVYVDTGTPLFRKDGIEQLDPEAFLQSVPAFLRWILRLFFLGQVMNRYYDFRSVLEDLAANLYKEGRPDLVAHVVEVLNAGLPTGVAPLTVGEIDAYYREDRLIWTLFLAFRRLDRFVKTRILGLGYDFVLPGRIKR